jgi:hypothetical protein
MSLKSGTATTTMFLLFAVVVVAVRAQAPAAGDPWSALQFRTAWIVLGAIDVPTRQWVVQLKHTAKTPPRPAASTTVEVGDILRITEDQPLVISNYAKTGESLRDQSPARVGDPRADLTGVTLPAGSEVVVRAVERGPTVGRIQEIWARVEPAASVLPRPRP